MILIIDFGSQYNQLIARRVREQHVYCQIEPPNITPAAIKALVEADPGAVNARTTCPNRRRPRSVSGRSASGRSGLRSTAIAWRITRSSMEPGSPARPWMQAAGRRVPRLTVGDGRLAAAVPGSMAFLLVFLPLVSTPS